MTKRAKKGSTWVLNASQLRDKLTGGVVMERFTLLVDLGEIVVPRDYDHVTWLARFRQAKYDRFYSYNDNITDAHFANPSRVLRPGDRLCVKAFRQIAPSTTSEERLAFLATQGGVHTGAQGASLVWLKKRDRMVKGYWYSSMDAQDRLWKDAGRPNRVPHIYADHDGAFDFDLDYFDNPWNGDHVLLCFRDVWVRT